MLIATIGENEIATAELQHVKALNLATLGKLHLDDGRRDEARQSLEEARGSFGPARPERSHQPRIPERSRPGTQ